MYRVPPSGAQAIGILNILFGFLGSLPWLFVLLGGSLLGLFGGAVAGSGGGPAGALLGVFGGMVVVGALLGMALHLMLLASGIGILQLAPWGRTLALVYAWLSVLFQAFTLVSSGFASSFCSLLGLVYPVVLLVVLNQPDWKETFR